MAKAPTAEQKRRWSRIAALGCMICLAPAEIHHCFTGGGGRKNHDAVIPLCPEHHRGRDGIDGRHYGMSKKKWQSIHGSEQSFLERVAELLCE